MNVTGLLALPLYLSSKHRSLLGINPPFYRLFISFVLKWLPMTFARGIGLHEGSNLILFRCPTRECTNVILQIILIE